jgi:hypothetical protein
MGVSRLDSWQLLTGQTGNTTGSATATEAPLSSYPVNALVTLHAFGTFGGGTLSLEVSPDGTNWVPAQASTPATLTVPGTVTWQGLAKGIRAKLTGATAANLNAIAVFNDQN